MAGSTAAYWAAGYGTETQVDEVSIQTPATVETRLGTLEFRDGAPTPDTSKVIEQEVHHG